MRRPVRVGRVQVPVQVEVDLQVEVQVEVRLEVPVEVGVQVGMVAACRWRRRGCGRFWAWLIGCWGSLRRSRRG
jgi:hypothetical protein